MSGDLKSNNSSKRVPKNPISFEIQLDDDQKRGKELAYNSDIVIIKGPAGTGKSTLAANVALDMLFKRAIDKIILTRATVTAGEDIGYLPGDKLEKLEPFIAPVKKVMKFIYKNEKTIENHIEKGSIEIDPVGFLRGDNFFPGSLVLVDEAQNLTDKQTKLILTRMCKNSKIIFCGDTDQCDLKNPKDSGFQFICDHLPKLQGVELIELTNNHRHDLVAQILDIYSTYQK